MSNKLLTEHHLEFLSLKGAAEALLSLHLSKYHIVGNHILRLISDIKHEGMARNATRITVLSATKTQTRNNKTFTHLCRMKFPMLIYLTSPFPF